MAQGTVVVTASGTATEEVAGDAGVLVDPHDAAALADALAGLLDDEAARRRLGAEGLRRAEGELTWERTAAGLASAFAEAAA
jgi:glycosyltransferase involved in cell wall biosynthesis